MAKLHIITGAAAAVVLMAGAATAQGVPDSFDAVQGRVNKGARVIVKDQAGRETEGVLTSLTPSAISLKVGPDQRQWAAADVKELRRRGDSVKDGTLRGLYIGLGVGIGIGVAAVAANEGGNEGAGFLLVSALGAGIGAAAGAGFDGLRQGQTVLFRRSSPGGGSVSLAPVLTPAVRAIRVTLGF